MSLKLCFNNEIHRASKLPVSISALNEMIIASFGNVLPSSWSLLYTDTDGDRITIKTEEDLAMMLDQLSKTGTSIKVYVSATGSVISLDSKLENDRKSSIATNPQVEESKVSNITGDKNEIREPSVEKSCKRRGPGGPCMKFFNTPKGQAIRIMKRLREEGLSESEKEKLQQELAQIKSTLTPEELECIEKMPEKFEKGHHGRWFRGPGHHSPGHHSPGHHGHFHHKGERSKEKTPKQMAKKIMKVLFWEKEMPVEERQALEAKLQEIEAQLTQEEKDDLAQKKTKWAAKAEKKIHKKLNFVEAFSSFLKDNAKSVMKMVGFGKHHHHHHKKDFKMKHLVHELLDSYNALPEEKKADVSNSLNGVPEKMLAALKEKKERKCMFKNMTEEERKAFKAKLREERAERKASKSKSKSRSKSPLKEATPQLENEADKKVATIREIFPDVDVATVRDFVEANPTLQVNELLQSFLTVSQKKL